MASKPSLGALLRRRRTERSLTIEELATVSGVSVRAISDMERGESLGPQRRTIEALADALALSDSDRAALLDAARVGRRRVPQPAPAVLAMPRSTADFAGRHAEIRSLLGLFGDERPAPARVAVLTGQPGVGKTSLAVHVAMLAADRFPDGRHFVDLRGLDERPVDPALVLERLIRALTPGQRRIPVDLADRAALFRTVLADRAAVLILDNAAAEAQVRPLLPGDGRSVVLITSRRLLTGLQDVWRHPVGPLRDADAVALLERLVAGRPAADADAVRELATLCGNLPLALRIVGNRMASRPDWGIDRLVVRLRDTERRLDTLSAGDLQISAAFALSYAQLTGTGRTLFRRLAVLPGVDTGVPLAAVLAGDALTDTEDALDELVELGLVQSGFTGRYRQHDLLRLFAGEMLDREEPGARDDVVARAGHWLLDTAVVAGRWFEPGFGALPANWDNRVPMDDAASAERWLRVEADNWLTALRDCAAGREHRRVVEVAEALHWFSDRWRHWGHWLEVYELSTAAAEALHDPAAAATQLGYQAWARTFCTDDLDGALECADRAYAYAVRAGDPRLQGWARYYRGAALTEANRPAAALEAARAAALLFRAAGDRSGLPQAVIWVGLSLQQLGRLDEALAASAEMFDIIDDPATAPPAELALFNRATAWLFRGRILAAGQRWAQAIAALRRAVPLAEEAGVRTLHGSALATLGDALCRSGDLGAGLSSLRRALDIFGAIDERAKADAVRSQLAVHTKQARAALTRQVDPVGRPGPQSRTDQCPAGAA